MERETNSTIRVYRADPATGGIRASLRQAAEDLHRSRFVVWQLFARDFVTQFRQKLLGYFWAVVAPLIAIASFVFMNATGILNPGDTGVPYALFAYIGTTVWGVLIAALTTVSNGLLGNTDLVMRTSIPPIALAVAGLAHVAYSIVVNFLVLLALLAAVGVAPSPWIIVYPLLLGPLLLLGIGIGLLLAVVGAVARDVTGMVTTALGLVMYITPVVYVTDFENPLLATVVALNPLAYLVDGIRNIILEGQYDQWAGFLVSTGLGVATVILGVHGFYLIKDKVAERL